MLAPPERREATVPAKRGTERASSSWSYGPHCLRSEQVRASRHARVAVGCLAAASVRVCSYCCPLVPRSIEAPGRASDVALDRLPTGATAHGHLDRVGLIPLVDMRGNSRGTTDANASAQQAAPCTITVQAFQVGERWRHGFTITAVAL